MPTPTPESNLNRISELEMALSDLTQTVTGNGGQGMDERVRALETWQTDQRRLVESMQITLRHLEKQMARFMGGLAVSMIFGSLGLGGIAWSLWRIYSLLTGQG